MVPSSFDIVGTSEKWEKRLSKRKGIEMRYETKSDLPETLRDILPDEALELYLEAYQHSWDTYDEEEGGDLSRDAVAHRDGWTAVEHEYVQNKETGEWYRRGEESPEASEEEDTGVVDKLKGLVEGL
jgi:cation transport regulator